MDFITIIFIILFISKLVKKSKEPEIQTEEKVSSPKVWKQTDRQIE